MTAFVKFKLYRKAYASSVLLSACLLLSSIATLLCNDRPLLLSYKGTLYTPFLKFYAASLFEEDYEMEAPYSQPHFIQNIEREGWILWAPIRFGPYTVDEHLHAPTPSAPDSRHLLGTDDRGRDVFVRLIFGFRISLLFGLIMAGLSGFLGMILGSLQAYGGSKVDLFIQRMIDVVSSLPELFVLMILCSIFQPSFTLLLGFMIFTAWIPFAAYTRGDVLRIYQLDYVRSAIQVGASTRRVLFHHILPNALTPMLTLFPLRVCSSIMNLASLDFLGMGLPTNTPSLGDLLLQGKNHLHCWWILLSTLCVLSFIVLTLHAVSEGIRHTMDPKL